MGLLILERKQWESKYEQVKATADSAQLLYKREQAARTSEVTEAKKREDNLKKALGIEKECVANVWLLALNFGFLFRFQKFFLFL